MAKGGDSLPIGGCRCGSVAKVWDVVIGVTTVALGGIVGDSQMVKSRKENEEPYDDDRNGAVWMLKA